MAFAGVVWRASAHHVNTRGAEMVGLWVVLQIECGCVVESNAARSRYAGMGCRICQAHNGRDDDGQSRLDSAANFRSHIHPCRRGNVLRGMCFKRRRLTSGRIQLETFARETERAESRVAIFTTGIYYHDRDICGCVCVCVLCVRWRLSVAMRRSSVSLILQM